MRASTVEQEGFILSPARPAALAAIGKAEIRRVVLVESDQYYPEVLTVELLRQGPLPTVDRERPFAWRGECCLQQRRKRVERLGFGFAIASVVSRSFRKFGKGRARDYHLSRPVTTESVAAKSPLA